MRVLDTNSFITRARILHGDTYSYTKTVYTNSKTKLLITCSTHGDFLQNPTNHYTKSGCPKCAGSGFIRKTEEIITEFKAVHGELYDYSLVAYTNEDTHVNITCNIHGQFRQQPKGHKQGQGCPKCAIDARRITQDTVIKRFQEAHADTYDYAEVNYTCKDNKVRIICKEHGVFEQRAADHWKGIGCQKCSKNGFDGSLIGYLYYLSVDNGKAFKIGITNRSVGVRFTITDLKTIEVLEVIKFSEGRHARDSEQRILKNYQEYKYTGPALLSSGNTELFYTDIRKVINVNSIREL